MGGRKGSLDRRPRILTKRTQYFRRFSFLCAEVSLSGRRFVFVSDRTLSCCWARLDAPSSLWPVSGGEQARDVEPGGGGLEAPLPVRWQRVWMAAASPEGCLCVW